MKPFQTLFLGHRSLSLAGLLFGSGLLAISLANPANWLQSGFETAINGSPAHQQLASSQNSSSSPIAGSESYWLGSSSGATHESMIQPVTWQAPVAKGDRFTISASNAASSTLTREFEVITIEPLLTTVRHDQESKTSAQQNQFLVICRSTDKSRPEVVKFLVDSTSAHPWATVPATTAHAL